MTHLGVAYGAVVMLGYDQWLLTISKRKHQEPRLLLILMLALAGQEALLLAAVLILR